MPVYTPPAGQVSLLATEVHTGRVLTVPTGRIDLASSVPFRAAGVLDVAAEGAATITITSPAGQIKGKVRSEGPATIAVDSRRGDVYLGYRRVSKKRDRWKWHDHYNNEHWEMPINPNSQTTPHRAKGIQTFARAPVPHPNWEYDQGFARVWAQKIQPLEWSFSGVIRSADFYHDFLRWRAKKYKLAIEDDFGRTYHVHVLDLDLKEDYPAPGRVAYKWRYEYTCKCLLHRISHHDDHGDGYGDDDDTMFDTDGPGRRSSHESV